MWLEWHRHQFCRMCPFEQHRSFPSHSPRSSRPSGCVRAILALLAVCKPAALGFAVTVCLFGNLLRMDAPRAVPYLVTYGGGTVVVGLAIGIILRLVAVTTIRLAGLQHIPTSHRAEWTRPSRREA